VPLDAVKGPASCGTAYDEYQTKTSREIPVVILEKA